MKFNICPTALFGGFKRGNMTKYNFLVFDLDGTLVDSKNDLAYAVNCVRKDYGFEALTIDKVRSFVGNGVKVLIEKSVPDTKGESVQQALDRFNAYYGKCLLNETKPYDGIDEMLKSLKGFKKAVLSNKPEKFSKEIINGLGWSEYFDEIFGADTIKGFKKPDTKVIFELMQRVRAFPQESIMIGDGINDIKIAKAADIASLAIFYGYTDICVLKNLEPDFTANNAQDIIKIIKGE
jgi:phosphoglycolate phosphatase